MALAMFGVALVLGRRKERLAPSVS
jgi:hypothetical protein